jgi:hypothetical protein
MSKKNQIFGIARKIESEIKYSEHCFWIRIGSGFNKVSGSGSGFRRAKMTPKNWRRGKKFHV